MMTEVEAAYIAGIFDGEGHVGVYTRWTAGGSEWVQMEASIGSTDLVLLTWIQERLGGRIGALAKGKLSRKQCFLLRWTSGNAATMLRLLRPHLRVKVKLVDVYLELHTVVRAKDAHRLTEDQRQQRRALVRRFDEVKAS